MQDKIVLATGHAHAYHRASTLAAIENGYFRDESLSQEIILQATGDDDLTAEKLKSEEIDFGLDLRPHSILEENSKGENLFIIAGMLNHLDLTLISTKDIKSIADLKGKKIGITEKGHGRDPTWMRMLLRKEGIDPDTDVTWVLDAGYTSLDIQGPRLDRGDYHATFLSGHYKRPELFDMVREAGYNHLGERSETHPDGLPDRVVATTGKILSQNFSIVRGVLGGIIRGYRFARDPKNSGKLLNMYLTKDWGRDGFGWGKFDDKLIDGMVASARILPPDGRISQSGLDAVIEEWTASTKLPEDLTKEDILRLEPLKEAVHELNAKFGPEGYE
jgi:ABC-type nitrate/sulfonate/bicarbonate transport system substrate-binding protein